MQKNRKIKIEVLYSLVAMHVQLTFSHSLFKYGFIYLTNDTKRWILQVKHPSLNIYRKKYITHED